MKRPEKIKEDYSLGRRDLIWNKACDEWDAWLPGLAEIVDLLTEWEGSTPEEIGYEVAKRLGVV